MVCVTCIHVFFLNASRGGNSFLALKELRSQRCDLRVAMLSEWLDCLVARKKVHFSP